MKQSKRFRCLFVMTLWAISFSSANAQEINGIATLKQLGSDIYHAAILVDATTKNPQELFTLEHPAALEVKIISNISKRSWSSLWTQGVAINNTAEEFSAHAQDFSQMLSAFKGPLSTNDVIKIELIPGAGTRVFVNNIELINGLSPHIFLLCLKSWVGPVPFSGAFKDGLLGRNISANQLSEYIKITPLETRQNIVHDWAHTSLAETSEEVLENDGIALAEEAASDESPSIDKTPFKELESTKTTIKVKSGDILLPSDIEPDIKRATEKSPARSPETATTNSEAVTPPIMAEKKSIKEDVASTSEQFNNEPPVQHTQQTPVTSQFLDKHPEEITTDSFSAKSLIAQQTYIQAVRKEVYRVAEYPLSALRRKIEGTVGVTMILKPNGELKSVEITEAADVSSFNKAILRAVQAASPFPSFPQDLKETELTVSTPFSFRLTE